MQAPDWLSKVDLGNFLAALVPLATGLVLDRVRPFLPKEADLLNRVRFLESAFVTKLASSYTSIMEGVLELPDDSQQLSGIASQHADAACECLWNFCELERLHRDAKRYYAGLFLSVIVAIVMLPIVLLGYFNTHAMIVAAISLIVLQITCAIGIWGIQRKIATYERKFLPRKRP